MELRRIKFARDTAWAIGAATFCTGACLADSAGCWALAIAAVGLAIMYIGILIEGRYCFEDDMRHLQGEVQYDGQVEGHCMQGLPEETGGREKWG